jgi:hypothetical protein
MKKKLLIFLSLVGLNGFALDIPTLQGDEKLSCEAILCLSTSARPSECSQSINRYFSISFRKWKDTVSARRNFLNICPVGGGNQDSTFVALRDNVISNLYVPCTIESLNREEERYPNTDGESYVYYTNQEYRINPEPTTSCKLLMQHSYTDFKAKYTCDKNKWYSRQEWSSGVSLESVSRNVFNSLPREEREIKYISSGEDGYEAYYKRVPINKSCWSFEQ